MKVLFVELAENAKFDMVRLVFSGRICYNWYNLFLYDFRLLQPNRITDMRKQEKLSSIQEELS